MMQSLRIASRSSLFQLPAQSARSSSAKAVKFGCLALGIATSATLWSLEEQETTVQAQYEVHECLGLGGFGRVHAARHKRTNASVAVKTIDKQQTTRAKFQQEVGILQACRSHANVLTFVDAFETKDAFVLVTELVRGSELFDQLMDHGVWTEANAQSLVQQICQTLAYLHANHIVHADLKPENIMIEETAQQIRLIDFGLSFRDQKPLERQRTTESGIGTMAYAAPEFIGQKRVTSAMDLWAVGVVLYVVLCGRHPFDVRNDASDQELRERILTGVFDQHFDGYAQLSSSAQDLIERLLVVDPAERLTATQVLQHPWVASA